MTRPKALVKIGKVQQRILLIRGEKVIIDADLAEAYGVTTKGLNRAIRRNADRFPPDFMFRLPKREKQEVVTSCDHLAKVKFSAVNARAFTEHGAIMTASVLNFTKAVEVSVFVVRAFVQLCDVLAGRKELASKVAQLDRPSLYPNLLVDTFVVANLAARCYTRGEWERGVIGKGRLHNHRLCPQLATSGVVTLTSILVHQGCSLQ
jgi:hypothetical protein